VIADSNSTVDKQQYITPISPAQYPEKTGFHFVKSNILSNPFEYSSLPLQFNDGSTDIRLNQFDQLSQFYSAPMKRKSILRKWEKQSPEGNSYFREQLANYLNYSRGLHISKDNLLITRSTEMSLYIISKLLLVAGDTVVVGQLNNFTANMIFQDAGAKIQTIPIDDQGIDTDSLRHLLQTQKIRMIYVTPHHHYPTTVTLNPERRIELLKLAEEYGFIILEDDYDYDFQYEKGIAMPMASADIEGMVIYIGTFGRSLAPSFRTGFVVAPKNLIPELQKYASLIDQQGDLFLEHVLGEMIDEGNIHRFLKKSLKIYRERRDHLCTVLDEQLSSIVSYQKPSGGLAIWLEWNHPISLLRLAQACHKSGLFIPKNILYQDRNTIAIRLGFGHLNTEEMTKSIEILHEKIVTMHA
jgi:GntR family transcriptional regulator/MocR family aminotransferase